MLSRPLMIPNQLFASTKKNHRIVRMNGSCVFFWVSEFSKTSHRLLSWLGFAWLTLNPLSCRVLHNHCVSLMQSRFVPFVKILVVCCYHIPKCSGNSNSVRWTVRICFAWRPCNFRASAYFAILVFGAWVNKLCFPPAFFEIGFSGRCAEGGIAGGGKATSAGDTSVELEDPLVNLSVNGWSHSANCVPHFARGRPQHVPASPRALVWCSVSCTAGTTKRMWEWDMMADLDAIHASTRAKVPRVMFFNHQTWTNVSESETYTVGNSRMRSSFCRHNDWCILRLFNCFLFFWSHITFYSSYKMKLPRPQWIPSLSTSWKKV